MLDSFIKGFATRTICRLGLLGRTFHSFPGSVQAEKKKLISAGEEPDVCFSVYSLSFTNVRHADVSMIFSKKTTTWKTYR